MELFDERSGQNPAEKRALIETVNDELKDIAQIKHSRHCSFNKFVANSLSAIAAYCFFEEKNLPLTFVLLKTGNYYVLNYITLN